MPFLQNIGELPDACRVRDEHGQPTGACRRVIVKLRNGTIHGQEPVSSTAPRGWDAKTTRWTLLGHSHDVVEFEVI